MTTVECHYCGLPVPGAVHVRQTELRTPAFCCYGCRLAARITGSHGAEGRNTLTLTLLGIAVFLSMNVMVMNWMLYGQEVYDPDGGHASSTAADTVAIFRYLSMLLAAPVLLILGWPVAASGLSSVRSRQINADGLIALGAAAAFAYSYVSVMRGTGSTYFDTVCMILVLVTAGRYIEAGAKVRASAACQSLQTLVPDHAVVIRDGRHVGVLTSQLAVGDLVFVKAGQGVPADGVIVENESHIDERAITGESEPVLKGPGGNVYAGSINGEGAIVFRASAVADATVLHGIVDLLVEARRGRGRFQRLADRIAAVFVPFVILLAVGTAAWSMKRANIEDGIMRGLSVVLIACPCALGLATPLAAWTALTRAARRGILLRKVTALEQLARIRIVLFDKTGTLTTGRAEVTTLAAGTGGACERMDVLAYAAGLAEGTSHHLSEAVRCYAKSSGVDPLPLGAVRTIAGKGVEGTDPDNGVQVILGSARFMDEKGLSWPAYLKGATSELASDGRSLACVGWDGRVRGVFGFSEALRPQAAGSITMLRRRRLRTKVLTGDHAARAERIGRLLGIEFEAELLPAAKVAIIQRLSSPRLPVAMVGDGINDAPALAAADVGIAMGCGTDLTRQSADVCLLSDDLAALPWLFDLARATVCVIRRNLFWAFSYNLVGLGLAATGRLSPIFSALAMVASSLFVLTNSLRLSNMNLRADSHDGSAVARAPAEIVALGARNSCQSSVGQ